MKCIRKGFFDEKKGYKFTSYLCSAVNNEIRMFLRKDRQEKSKLAFSMDQPLPLNGPAGSNDDKTLLTYGDAFIDDNAIEDTLEDQFLLEEAQGILCKVLPELNEVEFDCFMLYINGCPPKNIGAELGFSKNYPHKILAGVKAKFREKLYSDNGGIAI